MMTIYRQTPRRGSKLTAQGIALGTDRMREIALKGQKHYIFDSFALSGRRVGIFH